MEKGTKLINIKVLSYIFLVFVFIVGAYFYSKISDKGFSAELAEPIQALTEKQDYSLIDELKVKIENEENQVICFSSCTPYVIQVKNDTNWSNYPSPQCDKGTTAQTCIEPNQLKAFAINLNEMSLEPAKHRLAIPVCVGCAVGEQFRVDKILYSNEFEIK